MNKTFKVIYNRARKTLMVVNEKTRSIRKKSTKAIVATSALFAAGSAFAYSTLFPTLYTWDGETLPPNEIELTKASNTAMFALGITDSATGALSNASVTFKASDISDLSFPLLGAGVWSVDNNSNSEENSVTFNGDTATFTATASFSNDKLGPMLFAFLRYGKGTPIEFSAATTEFSSTITSSEGKVATGLHVQNSTYDAASSLVTFSGNIVNVNVETHVDQTTEEQSSDSRGKAYGIANSGGTISSAASEVNVNVKSLGETVASSSSADGNGGAADAYGIFAYGGTSSFAGSTTIDVTSVGGEAIGIELTSTLDGLSSLNTPDVTLTNATITATSGSSSAKAIAITGKKSSPSSLKVTGDLEVKATGKTFSYGISSEAGAITLGSEGKSVAITSESEVLSYIATLSNTELTITGSKYTQTGNGYGIYLEDNSTLTINASDAVTSETAYATLKAIDSTATITAKSFDAKLTGTSIVFEATASSITVNAETINLDSTYAARVTSNGEITLHATKELTTKGTLCVGNFNPTDSWDVPTITDKTASLTLTAEKATINSDIVLGISGGNYAYAKTNKSNTITLNLGDGSTVTGNITAYGTGAEGQVNKIEINATGSEKNLTYTGGIKALNCAEVSVLASEINLKNLKNDEGAINLKAEKIALSETTSATSSSAVAISTEEGTTTLTAKEISIDWNDAKATNEGSYSGARTAFMAYEKATLKLTSEEPDISDSSLTVSLEMGASKSVSGFVVGNESSLTVNHENVFLNIASETTADDAFVNDAPKVARGIYAIDSEKATSLTFAGNLTANVRANDEAYGLGLMLFAFDTTDTSEAKVLANIKGNATISAVIDENGSDSGMAQAIQVSSKALLEVDGDISATASGKSSAVSLAMNGGMVTVTGDTTLAAEASEYAAGVYMKSGTLSLGSSEKEVLITAKALQSAAISAQSTATINMGTATSRLKSVALKSELTEGENASSAIATIQSKSNLNIYADSYSQVGSGEGIQVTEGSSLTIDVGAFNSTTKDSAVFVDGDSSSASIKADTFTAKITSAGKDSVLIRAQNNGSFNLEAKTIDLDAWDGKWDVLSADDGGTITLKADDSLTFKGVTAAYGGTLSLEGKTLNLAVDCVPLNSEDTFFYGVYTVKGKTSIAADEVYIGLTSSDEETLEYMNAFYVSRGELELKPKSTFDNSILTISQDCAKAEEYSGIYAQAGSTVSIDHENVTVNLNQAKNESTGKYTREATASATGVYVANSSLEISSGNLSTNVRAKHDANGLSVAPDGEEGSVKPIVTIAGDTTIKAIAESPSDTGNISIARGLYLRGATGSFGKNLDIYATADNSKESIASGIVATWYSEASFATSDSNSSVSITSDAYYSNAIQMSVGTKLSFGKEDQECASVTLKAFQKEDIGAGSSVVQAASGSTLDIYTKKFSQEGTYYGLYLSGASNALNTTIKATDTFSSTTGKSAILAIGSVTKAAVSAGSFVAKSTSTETDYALLETSLGAAIDVSATSIELQATGNKNALQATNWGSFNLKASDSFTVDGNITATFTSADSLKKTASFDLQAGSTLSVNGDIDVSRAKSLEGDVSAVVTLNAPNVTMTGDINVTGNNYGDTSLTINAAEAGTSFTHKGAIAVTDGATLSLMGGTYQPTSFVLTKSTLKISEGTTVSGTIELKDNSNFASSLSTGFTGVTVDETGAVTYADTVTGNWSVKGDETSTLTVDDTFALTSEGLSKLGAAYNDVTLNFVNATLSLTEDLTVNSHVALQELTTDKTITVSEDKSFGLSGNGESSSLQKVILSAKESGTQGGSFKTSNESKVSVSELVSHAGARIVVSENSELTIGTLSGEATGTKIIVGEVGGEGASLTVEKLTMTGGYIFVDPSIGHSTFTVSEYGTNGLNNCVTAANGSLVVFGASESVATNAISQIDGLDSVEALVYVASPLALGESGSLLINSDATDSTTEYADATKVQITKGALVFNQNDIGSSAVFTDASTVTVESGATIAVLNAQVGSSIALTSESNTVTVNGTPTVLTDSPFAKGSVDSSSKSVVIEGTADTTGLSVIASMGVQSMIRHADAVLAETLADRAATSSTANNGSNLWVAVRADRYEQDHLGATGGFSADMGYGAFGVDVAPDATKNFGAAFQYGRGTVKGDIYSVKNKTRDYSFALYGSVNLGDSGVKLLGDVMFTKSTNKITNTYYTGLNQGLDAYMLSAGVTAQTSFEMSNFTLTPSVGIRASRLKTDAMKMGLSRLDSQHQNFVQVPLSLRLTGKTASTENGWEVTPRFKVSFIPTFGDKSISVYGEKEAVLDTRPLQGAFGLKFAKGAATFDAGAHFGVGNRGTSAIGAKVDFTYRF